MRVAAVVRDERCVEDAEEPESVEPLTSITLHECRCAFASPMIAAGVKANALSTHRGHSLITTTLDRHGHLTPGNEAEAGTSNRESAL